MSRIREIKKGQTHRDIWPEQYSDPLVGVEVEVVTKTQGSKGKGKVIRVFDTRFGRLAEVEGVGEKGDAWLRSDCKVIG